jgi:hypothetical protein
LGSRFLLAAWWDKNEKKQSLWPRKKKRRDGKNEETGCRSQNSGEVLTLDSEII